VRVYVPATIGMLRRLVDDGQLAPVAGTAFGVTPALRESYAVGTTEELEYAAMADAARASLRLLAGTLAPTDSAPGPDSAAHSASATGSAPATGSAAHSAPAAGSAPGPDSAHGPAMTSDTDSAADTAWVLGAGSAPGSPSAVDSALAWAAGADSAPAPAAVSGNGAEPARRVVVCADIEGVRLRPDLDDGAVTLPGPVPGSAVAAVYVDLPDAVDAVRAAAEVVDAADMGDPDAEFILGDADDHDLAWYAPQEIPFLLELL